MSAAVLTGDEVRFVNLVAARRSGSLAPGWQPPALALDPIDGDTPFARAAALAAALARPGVLETASLPTILLATCCQLRRDGHRLMAPQGVAAGMTRGLANGSVSAAEFAAWLKDRAVAD